MAWKDQTKNLHLEIRDGLTPKQRFFVGNAQWACANDPENLRVNAITDPHSPDRYRVNGLVVNMPEFEKAFSCKAPISRWSKQTAAAFGRLRRD